MRFFIAGIMQGSHPGATLHGQEYRERMAELIRRYYPDADIYDPRAEHCDSVEYDDHYGREVFLGHNQMCGEVDVVVAYIPEASMGTAIEIWEAFRNDKPVVKKSFREDERCKKYVRMMKMHIPVPAICMKMEASGNFVSEEIEAFRDDKPCT